MLHLKHESKVGTKKALLNFGGIERKLALQVWFNRRSTQTGDTTVTTITTKQDHGNIPAARVTFFSDKLPEVQLAQGQRLAKLRYKTDKESNTLRSSMAVVLNRVSYTSLIHQTDKGSEVLQSLVDEVLQDAMLKRVADKSEEFSKVEDAQALVSDYLDNSRTSSGKKVTQEIVAKFFDDSMTKFLVEKIVSKFPKFDQDKVLAVVNQHRQAFIDLAKYSLPQTKAVTEVIRKDWEAFIESEHYEAENELNDWIGERIKKLMDRHNAAEMLIEAI